MSASRNDPCPCGSGRKYKKCCLIAPSGDRREQRLSPRFRFEHGSYGGPGRGFMPSAICYEQVAPSQWDEYFCLVNVGCRFETENEASVMAEADLSEASAAKSASGSDAEFALSLKNKGYIKVDAFRRAVD